MTGTPSPDAAMANLPDDMVKVTDIMEAMALAISAIMKKFPQDEEGAVPVELLRPATRLALVSAANALEYGVSVMNKDLAWARAKVLAWCAAEAEWEALKQ